MAQGFLAETTATTMISMQMQQDAATGITYLDTVMASMSLASLGATPMMVDHPVPVLEELHVVHPCSLCLTLGSIGILA